MHYKISLIFCALQYCEENEGELVEIWTEKKQKKVNDFIDDFEKKNPGYSEHYWIGKKKNQ